MGVPDKDLVGDRHWNEQWPRGQIDDSTDDDKIMNWIRAPKEATPAIKYHEKMRMWEEGTWPVYHTWNAPMDHASYHSIIDDGTDDAEVLNVQHRNENI